ncbi:uncharacterized protein PHALS_06004 [Plasmopara halstedii]|uniref:Uncharacterized protein n=1 Tax=Plasmopara halstedii TaxID=4781 RepID=A0A0P1AC24_PLAHL|nr:uncharacterized protein PHALS_06004 [Plasmopara halstedii]CEG37959.1 hypothetical protein PHALS_06004 [Plasmopara halstedii]|eukprot:XP_024574328.1 hypothetical protein PHALS_06004 [Plasmopara halstedii]
MRNSALPYSPVSTHTTLEDAKLALHAFDAFDYITAYNYGTFRNASVYRCISHKACDRRLRIVEKVNDEDEIPVTFQLAVHGEHGSQVTNRKRIGIDLLVKGEVDELLARGMSLKKCRLALQRKYADEPEMLAKIPDENRLRNRRITLRKKGWKNSKAVLPSMTMCERLVKAAEWDESSDSAPEVNSSMEDDTSEEQQIEVAKGNPCTEQDEQFDKKRLMEEFTAHPGRPVFWNILKRTTFLECENNDVMTEWITGQVIGWQTKKNAPTKWIVRYSDGVKQPFQLEQLIDEMNAAARVGLDVRGRCGVFC